LQHLAIEAVAETKAREIACPRCGKLAVWSQTNAWRPFCSERCKMIDLGAWASDSYRIPIETPEDSLPDAPEDEDR
jgi:endogenous inhibitor of DNA gyrase (YacG/DUF329 family)